jgi:hypothetical protein
LYARTGNGAAPQFFLDRKGIILGSVSCMMFAQRS